MKLDALIIEPKNHQKIDACIIWLHGLGADGYDFKDITSQLRLPSSLNVKFIFPHAPIRPVTLNQGFEMRAWYDIYGLSAHSPEDKPGIQASQSSIEALVQNQIDAGIPAKAIFLGGFSQGGAMALTVGVRFKQALAGIMGLSTYLPMATALQSEKNLQNQATPILLTHGVHDDILPLSWGLSTKEILEKSGYSVDWKTYNMAHQICLEEVNDIRSWVLGLFPPSRKDKTKTI